MNKNRLTAILAAILVTILWSSSYFLNKYAFHDGVGPMTLAGLRYLVACLFLWGVTKIKRGVDRPEKKLPVRTGLILGITGYLMAQGLQYVGQFFITPTQTSLLLNIGNVSLVAAIAAVLLKEKVRWQNVIGMVGVIMGAGIYYFPYAFRMEDYLGIIFVLLSCLGYAFHLSLNRLLLTNHNYSTTELLLVPMGIGSAGMLTIGLLTEGFPHITLQLIFILFWLGIVNGSLAFSLWTWSQKHLDAFESSVINNLMLIEIALLDFLLLHSKLSLVEFSGLFLVLASILFVSIRKKRQTGEIKEQNPT